MKPTTLAVLTVWLSLAGISAAPAASINGPAALALAGVVAPQSPLLSAGEKDAIAALFAGQTRISYDRTISIVVDRIACRTSNVDITLRSCELTFKKVRRKLTGRDANELYATVATIGIPPDGAAGSIFESLSKLTCTLDPAEIKEKAGGGAECSYEAAK